MKAVVMNGYGGVDVLGIGEVDDVSPGSGEVLVRIRAAALNRADLLQRRGMYPPPKGASEVLGLEMAGEIVELGEGVTGLSVGQRIAALLPGGGYATHAVIPAGMAMPLPDSVDVIEGAAIPEAFLTAYLNLFLLGGMAHGKTVLIHAGASGVGTSAIQLVREAGGVSIVTAGSRDKIERCIKLGAMSGWNYHDGSFAPFVAENTSNQGVDIILDFIGEPYFEDNLVSLAVDGRLIIIGTMGGVNVNSLNLGTMLGRRLQIIGTALRSQTVERKIEITRRFWEFAEEGVREGRIRPVIDSVYDWREVADAHRHMEENRNVGKIVLQITD